jgi:hypothetical protein
VVAELAARRPAATARRRDERAAAQRITAERGELADPDLTLSGNPRAVIAALVLGESSEAEEATIEGDRDALEQLRAMIVLPERLRDEALDEGAVTARTA